MVIGGESEQKCPVRAGLPRGGFNVSGFNVSGFNVSGFNVSGFNVNKALWRRHSPLTCKTSPSKGR